MVILFTLRWIAYTQSYAFTLLLHISIWRQEAKSSIEAARSFALDDRGRGDSSGRGDRRGRKDCGGQGAAEAAGAAGTT